LWRSSTSSRWGSDALLLWSLRGLALISTAIVVLIALFVARESFPLLRTVSPLRLLTDGSWNPLEGAYNLAPMLVGTLLVSAGAVLISAPLGVASALFCHFYAPPLFARGYRVIIELLAGIPSVVYGLWGLVVIVPLLGRIRPLGASVLAGNLILALMILPTMVVVADAAFARVPREYLQAAAALGLSKWTTIRSVVIPAARRGLITGALLQTGRAVGETMAVLMVCGNVVAIPARLTDPVRTLTANIALEMAYAMGNHRAALFTSGLMLFLMIFVIVACAEFVNRERSNA
jgi:phosphate transport system permease protein